MNVRYVVDLTDEERQQLRAFVAHGSHGVREVKRAQILLAADAGHPEAAVAATVVVSPSTVYRIKRRFVEGGLARALRDDPRPGAGRKLTGQEEARLVATACAAPPRGRARWTLDLLAGEMVRLTGHTALSRETVRRRLAEQELKPWQKKRWCIPQVDAAYVARMEDVLDLYAEAAEPAEPVVCFDESPVQLIGETRVPIAASPGQPARIDYEYRRNGTANLFMFVDAHRPWRHVKVTDQRTALDFAACMRDLVEVHYPEARRIRVVLDNLSSHSAAALSQAYPQQQARRILRRLELHFVPTHASWLNLVEIEIGVLKRQCLDRRIGDRTVLEEEIAAWEAARNGAGARIHWRFTTAQARATMGRAYPVPAVPTAPAAAAA